MATNKAYQCRLCGHKWLTRIESKPVQCPRCKRCDWAEKIISGGKQNE